MLHKLKVTLLFVSLLLTNSSLFAQRGKDGSSIITTANQVVNNYTYLTSDGVQGTSSVTVNNPALTGGIMTTSLAAGDLIMIVQMQGVFKDNYPGHISIDINTHPVSSWGGTATLETLYGQEGNNPHLFGKVFDYYQAGNFELKEVAGVTGNNIFVTCPLENNYNAAGHVQVIRVPRFDNLTIQSGGSIVSPVWSGVTGGVVAIEVKGNFTNNAVGGINVSSTGFRGGQTHVGVSSEGNNVSPNSPGSGDGFLGADFINIGAQVGEGIFGFTTEYNSYDLGYGRGALANGGGGGGIQNAGGGGGANVGDITNHTGKGIPTPGYPTYWNAEKAGFATSVSSGGGRGGYTYANTQKNPNIGPNKTDWGGNARKENGGMGGHANVYDPKRIFFGGGGGAGGQDTGQGGSGGRGGGIVYLNIYGTISGTGSILANGQKGYDTNPNNEPLGSNKYRGNDGGGGGGAGGYIYIRNANPIPSTQTLTANGGAGGDVKFLRAGSTIFNPTYNELTGPGGAGAGGGIAYSSGTPTTSVTGGVSGRCYENGSVNPWLTTFPMNGATNGGTGLTNLPVPTLVEMTPNNVTMCGNPSSPNTTGKTLSVTLSGALPPGSNVYWYTMPYGGNSLGSGTTFTIPSSNSTLTTFYAAICPGNYRVPVSVIINAKPIINGPAVITHATCNTQGSISGLSITGNGPFSFMWNTGLASLTPNLSSVAPGTYNFTVTDANGCTTTSNNYVVNGVSGPTFSGTAVIAHQRCNTLGSITGLTATSPAGITSYSWNGTAAPNATLSNVAAGSYTLTVTDGNGCTATSGPYVIQNIAPPSINGTPITTGTTCNILGSISGLSVSGCNGCTYQWNGVASPTLNISSLQAGAYTLIVKDSYGCTDTLGPINIIHEPNPSIDDAVTKIFQPTCVDLGEIRTTISGGRPPFTYQWNGVISPSNNINNIGAGTYQLIVTDMNGCSDTSNVYTLTLPPNPTIVPPVDTVDATCTTTGRIIDVGATGGTAPYTYLWDDAAATTGRDFAAGPGTYSVTVTDSLGCTAVGGPYTIGMMPPPTFGGTPVIVDVTCTVQGSISGITVTSGVAPYTYSWNNGAYTTLDISGLPIGAYTLEVTDANGCVITSGPHTVNGTSVPAISGVVTLVQPTCVQGGSISGLTVSGGATPYSYEWNGVASATADVSGLQPNSYTFEVTDGNGCEVSSGPYVLVAPALPVIGGTPSIQNVNCLHEGSINGITVSSGLAPYTYSWNNGLFTTLNIQPLPVGSYTLTVTDANGCTATNAPLSVIEESLVDAQFSYSPNPVQLNDEVNFHDESTGNVVNWNWTIEGNPNTLANQHPTYTFTTEGTYDVTLIVTDANGCKDSITYTIDVISEMSVPNVVTANNDGVNDYFVIKGLVPNTKVVILNRWGNVIYWTDHYDNLWDGREQSGQLVPEGVYTYKAIAPDGKMKHGFVHIVH